MSEREPQDRKRPRGVRPGEEWFARACLAFKAHVPPDYCGGAELNFFMGGISNARPLPPWYTGRDLLETAREQRAGGYTKRDLLETS